MMDDRQGRVLVSRALPGDSVMSLRDAGYQVEVGGASLWPRDELLRRVVGVDALLCQLSEQIDEALLDAAGPQLRIVSNYAVGTNNIDVAACTTRRIWVGHTPDVLTEATADVAWALILAVARRIGEAERLVRSGAPWQWSPSLLLGRELSGATLAIIGPGRIGTAVAQRSQGWRMRLLYVGHRRAQPLESLGAERASLRDALQQADVVSLHVPLTEQTRGMIDAEALRLMKSTAVLINTARGAVIDEMALAAALQQGQLAGAGLDVHAEEPRVCPALLDAPGVVLLPHIGSATRRAREAMATIAVANISQVLGGSPPVRAVNDLR